MRKAAVAAGMLSVMAGVGGAQALPSLPTTAIPHAASIETMYKQMGLIAHAAKGQTLDQQKIDGKQCFDTAVGATGFDPRTATSGNATALAAQAASVSSVKPSKQVTAFRKSAGGCLESRGYTVKYR